MLLFDFNQPYAWFIWGGGGTIWLWRRYRRWDAKIHQDTQVALKEANSLHGTAFPTDKEASAKWLTVGKFGWPGSYYLIFDVPRRKVAFSTVGACRVFDFSEVSSWQVFWTEKSTNGVVSTSGHHMLVQTSAVDLPACKVLLDSMADLRAWNLRLQTILDAGCQESGSRGGVDGTERKGAA